jgi:hypothetical protein
MGLGNIVLFYRVVAILRNILANQLLLRLGNCARLLVHDLQEFRCDVSKRHGYKTL